MKAMSLDKNFKPFNFNEGIPRISITSHGMTFNKTVVMKLGYPEHVLLLINEEAKRIAVQPCSQNAPNAAAFYNKAKKSNLQNIRWNASGLLNTIQDLMGWDLSQCGYRIEGILLKEDHAMLFDLTLAREMK